MPLSRLGHETAAGRFDCCARLARAFPEAWASWSARGVQADDYRYSMRDELSLPGGIAHGFGGKEGSPRILDTAASSCSGWYGFSKKAAAPSSLARFLKADCLLAVRKIIGVGLEMRH